MGAGYPHPLPSVAAADLEEEEQELPQDQEVCWHHLLVSHLDPLVLDLAGVVLTGGFGMAEGCLRGQTHPQALTCPSGGLPGYRHHDLGHSAGAAGEERCLVLVDHSLHSGSAHQHSQFCCQVETDSSIKRELICPVSPVNFNTCT